MRQRWTQALRSLLRRPSFAIAAVVILGTGIAAITAVFSIVDTVLLKPLPYPDPERLVTVMEASASKTAKASLIAPVRLEDWNRMNRTFDAIAASYSENVTDTSGSEPERLAARDVSPRYFDVFGAKPAIGRTFTPEENVSGGPAAAVISYRLWTRRFGQNPNVVGQRLVLKGKGFTIVGVMPSEFASPAIDLWIPAQLAPFLMQLREARFYSGVGRLKPGVTIAKGQQDLARVQRELGEQFPQSDKDWSAIVADLKEGRIGSYREPLIFIMGSVGLLLLIAVANIASLTLTQLQKRERELAIRNSIGATRTQVIGTVVREVLWIAFAAVLVACVLDIWGLRALSSNLSELPSTETVRLDWRALAFAAFCGIVASVLAGVLPAIRATRTDLASVLSHTGRGIAANGRMQQLLVTGQIALAVVLLSSTGLMLRSYYNLEHVELGFDPSRDITFHVGAAWDEDRVRVGELQKNLVERLKRIPGMTAVGFANFLPASDATLRYQIQIQEVAHSDDSGKITVGERSVAADYFQALGAPILSGESCPDINKDYSKTPKALVNRRFADLYSNGENLVGRHFNFSQDPPNAPAIEIVGIVGDIREDNLRVSPVPYVYSCLIPGGWPDPEYILRSSRDPRSLAQDIRAAVHDVDPGRAVFGVQALQEELDSTLDQTRLQAGMIAFFGFAAIALATIGLYGLVTLAVAARTREIGIRLALGADPGRILLDVFGKVGLLLMSGVAVGLLLTVAAQRELRTVIYGVSPLDWLTLATAMTVLAIATAVATFLPARRAAMIDPLTAMRE